MATYTTFADARTAYLANADYAEVGSATKAALFASACRALLLLIPSKARQGDVEGWFDPNTLREQLNAAVQYRNDSDGGGGVVDVSLEEFRT